MVRRLLPALATVALAAVLTPRSGAVAQPSPVDRGRELYLTGCVSCHGDDGGGVSDVDGRQRGPALRNAGEATAYYYLHTGRMPLANPDETPQRKRRAYSEDDIDALVAFVASLGRGPDLPDVDPANGDLAVGGEVYRLNCAPCHSAAGVGGALSYGHAAPNLHPASDLEIAAAVRAGPGQMPVFPTDAISREELDSLVRYVQYLDQPDDRGGLPLGRVGPIPEGFVTWVIGVGVLLLMVGWIGTRMPRSR